MKSSDNMKSNSITYKQINYLLNHTATNLEYLVPLGIIATPEKMTYVM